MSQDCTMTPIKARRTESADGQTTVARVLVMGSPEPERERTPLKNLGGRPKKKGAVRPPVDPRFAKKGTPTAEGWGHIRGYIEATEGLWSWRDYAAIFNVAKETLCTLTSMGRSLAQR